MARIGATLRARKLVPTSTVRIFIGHLRQKLGDDPAQPKLIVTELGVGYRLVDEDP